MYAYGADITLVVASSDETIAEDSTLLVGLGDKLPLSLVFYECGFLENEVQLSDCC